MIPLVITIKDVNVTQKIMCNVNNKIQVTVQTTYNMF